MPLKNKKTPEVRHLILADDMEKLNLNLAGFLQQGYRVVEAKLVNSDFHNRVFTVFYILVKDGAEEVSE